MLELIDRVDLGPGATYDDYCEVVETLMCVQPDSWPNPDSVVEVPKGHLLYEVEPEYSEFDFVSFAEDMEQQAAGNPAPADAMSEKMELFFKKVIASVYLDGVTSVTDAQGNPPNSANNYLMSEDGKQFTGIFYDAPPNEQAKKFPFTIQENQSGKWVISY